MMTQLTSDECEKFQGMKASPRANTASSIDFLYQCSKILSSTIKGEKAN
jgi:hypothetical protein